jgi:hypothetical protein
MFCNTTFADDKGTCGENLTWTYVEATKTLTISGSGSMTNYNTSSDYPWHNYRASISKVVLENGVISIGSYAFADCTSLSSITIPNSVANVGWNALQGIKKTIWLTNTPPSGWQNANETVNYVSNNQFGSSNNIIVYPFLSSLFEVDGVKYVPVSPSDRTCDAIDCVYDESKTEVNINTSVIYQGIDMKVINVQPYTFYQNPFIQKVNLDISGRLSQYALSNCQNLQIALLGNNVTNIDDYAFNGCRKLEGIIIPDEVNAIGQYAFSDCSEMNSVHIGDGTSIISQHAFSSCSNMTSARIGNGTKTISDYAFSDCTSLNSVIFGDSTKFINPYAFQNCSSLSAISIPGTVRIVGDNAFSGCKSLKELTIKEGEGSRDTTLLGNYRIGGGQSRTIVIDVAKGDELSFKWHISYTGYGCITIRNGNSGIGNSVPGSSGTYKNLFDKAMRITIDCNTKYQGSVSLEYIKLVEGGNMLINSSVPIFADCPLDSVYIDRDISYIFKSPFYNNTSLRSVVITDNVEEITANEFFSCTNLQYIEIGNGVTSIGDWAFSCCTSLNHIGFGSKVNSIGKEAFSDCTALTDIVSRTIVPPTCGDQALDDINKWTCKLIVPQGYVPVYQAADQWKDFFFIEEGEAPDIPPTSPGDANGDGVVDVADVVAIVNYILNKPGENFNEKAADVNEDGVIDVADVVAVVNIILKGGNANSPEAKAHARAYLKAHGFIVP